MKAKKCRKCSSPFEQLQNEIYCEKCLRKIVYDRCYHKFSKIAKKLGKNFKDIRIDEFPYSFEFCMEKEQEQEYENPSKFKQKDEEPFNPEEVFETVERHIKRRGLLRKPVGLDIWGENPQETERIDPEELNRELMRRHNAQFCPVCKCSPCCCRDDSE